MARRLVGCGAELWARAVQCLPPEPMKFALNASLDTLPTNANLHTWGKKSSDVCALCSQHRQSLVHVLNNCPVAMELRCYSRRQDEVLKVVAEFVQAHLPQSFIITTDLDTTCYCFPHHIVATNLRPDITWWSDELRELWMFELTISYESCTEDARRRKQAKYHDLVEAGCEAGYSTELITLEVGSRGMVSENDFGILRSILHTSRKDTEQLVLSVIRATLLGSFKIWGSRNTIH